MISNKRKSFDCFCDVFEQCIGLHVESPVDRQFEKCFELMNLSLSLDYEYKGSVYYYQVV